MLVCADCNKVITEQPDWKHSCKEQRAANRVARTTKRYCPMCETWTTKRECKECGMPTETPAKESK